MHVLFIRCVFRRILILIFSIDGWSLDFEEFIFRSGLLDTCSSALLHVSLVLVEKVAESHFEFIIKIFFPLLYLR